MKTEDGKNFPAVSTRVVVVNIHAMPMREAGYMVNTVLVKRKNEPFKDCWELPGGFLEDGETLEACANRELFDEAGIKNRMLFPIGAFSTVGRDPRGQTITFAYSTVIPTYQNRLEVKSGDDATEVKTFAVKGRAYHKDDLDEKDEVVTQDYVSVLLHDPEGAGTIQYVARFALDKDSHKVAVIDYGKESTAQLAFDHAEIIALAVANHSNLFNPKRNAEERAPEILEQEKHKVVTPADTI